ncbi:MAG: dNTP triphosphohydrolase [Rhodobacteraceae bacterium]|nr:dNTP triphosphohydrolase [Paracoccaceae bacterium]MCY4250589.1 dNTP triphosphohydrolase [Paracoccaceae bacterium]MCY4307198.1 dNTP triphosphohydrolase [Paracoccaceae bacterium]
MIDCAVKPDVDPQRLFPEKDYPQRSPFNRDGDRIIHASAFRRLIGKTQVFIKPQSDHVRNRLTHTIEVSRASRQIAAMLGLNPGLAEAIALVHDMGHPPYGHIGENILDGILSDYGGFNHNVQALRVVTLLENPYPDFIGLNLSWFCLEGIIKHNGPFKTDITAYVHEYNSKHDLLLNTYPSCEAQIASLADDIAYNCHDLQDGLRAKLFSLYDISSIPLVEFYRDKISATHNGISETHLSLSIIRKIFGYFVSDLNCTSKKALDGAGLKSLEEVRNFQSGIITFSDEAKEHLKSLNSFLLTNMYEKQVHLSEEDNPEKIITNVFEYFMTKTNVLPDSWQKRINAGQEAKIRIICDYIAGMTEKFIYKTYKEIVR